MDADFSFKITRDMVLARILVLLDLREGLALKICLTADYGNITQIMDYEGVPFRCHICHFADHLVAKCERPFQGMRWTDGRKEWVREEDLKFKKAKGSIPGTIYPPPSSPLSKERTIHILKPSQATGVSFSDVLGARSEAEKPVTEVVDLSSPLSGMNLSPPVSFFDVSSVGSEISLHDINMLSRSPSLLIRKSPSQNLGCYLPQNIGTIPNPLVASCSSEENSTGENFVVYSRRSRVVLTNSQSGQGNFTGNSRGRGGDFVPKTREKI